jgi:hypothetical protein
MEDVPNTLDYGTGFENPHSEVINIPWLAPKGEISLGSFDPADVREAASSKAIEEIAGSKRVFLIYSAVKYKGLNGGQTYTSTYCYKWYAGALRMWGGYGWNKYT